MKPKIFFFIFGALLMFSALQTYADNINQDPVNGYAPFAWSNNLTDYNSELVTDAWHGTFAQKFSFTGEHNSWIQVRKTLWKTFTRSDELSFWGKASLQSNTYIKVMISVRKDSGQWYVIDTTAFVSGNNYYVIFFFGIPSGVPAQFNQIEFKFILEKASGSGTMSGSINLDYMYSSYWGGVHIETIDDFGDLVGIQNQNEIAEMYSLSQNYPNPFNNSTALSFKLLAASDARLVVYDALGKEIEVLVNEELKAGTYKVDWNASEFSSGTYFYRLTAGEFSETKKMVLTK